MPAKGRRTASRQGQLKRKKTQKGPTGIPSTNQGVAAPENDDAVAVPAGVDEAEIESSEAGETSTVAAAAPQPARTAPATRTPRGEFVGQGQNRLRGERPAAYLYVGAEFRRIAMLTSVIITALVVLGLVL